MPELLNLFTVCLFLMLLGEIRWVKFNKDYLALHTTNYLKGWLAIAIVLVHLSTQLNFSRTLFHSFEKPCAYFIVAAFLFFSGFGSQKRHMSVPNYASSFLWRHLLKIFVPYLIVNVCYVLIQHCYGHTLNLYQIFYPWQHGKTLIPDGWFIFYIAVFYIAFWILMKCFKQNYRAIFIGTIIYCILWIIFCTVSRYGHRWFFNVAILPFAVFYAWKENMFTRLLEKSYKWVFLTTVLAIGLIFWCFHWKHHPPHYILYNVSSILFVITLILFSAKFQIGNCVLKFLGNIYLEIYLVQAIFTYTVPMRRFRVFLSDDFLWCSIVLMCTIIGGYALHIVCQKLFQMHPRTKSLSCSKPN